MTAGAWVRATEQHAQRQPPVGAVLMRDGGSRRKSTAHEEDRMPGESKHCEVEKGQEGYRGGDVSPGLDVLLRLVVRKHVSAPIQSRLHVCGAAQHKEPALPRRLEPTTLFDSPSRHQHGGVIAWHVRLTQSERESDLCQRRSQLRARNSQRGASTLLCECTGMCMGRCMGHVH